MAKSKNEIATRKNSEVNLATRQERVGQGSENVSLDDLAIPRIKVLQKLSPEIDPTSGDYIEGAQVGMLCNTVTNELSTSLFVVNLYYDRQVVVWKKRKLGGGIFGSFANAEDAIMALDSAAENEDNYDLVDTPMHVVYMIDEEFNHTGNAIIDFPSTKQKISKKWNTMIKDEERAGNPRFGTVYEVTSFEEKNSEGTHFNFKITKVVQAGDLVYSDAASEHDAIVAGMQKSQEQEEKVA